VRTTLTLGASAALVLALSSCTTGTVQNKRAVPAHTEMVQQYFGNNVWVAEPTQLPQRWEVEVGGTWESVTEQAYARLKVGDEFDYHRDTSG
jgi:hypothetical protein